MELVRHVGFDPVARFHVIQFGTLVDMNPLHSPIGLDEVILTVRVIHDPM